jgi:hypothetical protein
MSKVSDVKYGLGYWADMGDEQVFVLKNDSPQHQHKPYEFSFIHNGRLSMARVYVPEQLLETTMRKYQPDLRKWRKIHCITPDGYPVVNA